MLFTFPIRFRAELMTLPRSARHQRDTRRGYRAGIWRRHRRQGLSGCGMVTPRKTPPGGAISTGDKKDNTVISAFRAAVERVVAHFKNWRIFHSDYRRPYNTYREAYDAARGLFFFSITWDSE